MDRVAWMESKHGSAACELGKVAEQTYPHKRHSKACSADGAQHNARRKCRDQAAPVLVPAVDAKVGGAFSRGRRWINPTIVRNVSENSPIAHVCHIRVRPLLQRRWRRQLATRGKWRELFCRDLHQADGAGVLSEGREARKRQGGQGGRRGWLQVSGSAVNNAHTTTEA